MLQRLQWVVLLFSIMGYFSCPVSAGGSANSEPKTVQLARSVPNNIDVTERNEVEISSGFDADDASSLLGAIVNKRTGEVHSGYRPFVKNSVSPRTQNLNRPIFSSYINEGL